MATLGESITRIGDQFSALGTGTKYKDFNPADTKHIVLTPKSLSFPLSQEFDLAYFESLQLAGNAIVLKNVFEFVPDSTENTYQTSATGVDQLAQKAKPKYSFKFTDGMGMYKSLASLDTRNFYNVIFIDSSNNWVFTEKRDDAIKGMFTTHVTSEPIMINDGSNVTSMMLKLQLSDGDELKSRSVWLKNEKTKFNISEVDGINQLVYSFETLPADTDTDVVINVFSMVNRDIDIATALDTETTSMQVNVNGIDVVPTALIKTGVNQVTATITALSSTDEVYVKANPFSLTDVGLFQAAKSSTQVVA